MRRREFITGLGGAAASAGLPLAVRAQQGDRVRRIGVLMGFDENDAQVKGWLSGFVQGLAELGWTNGHNLRMDVRWSPGNIERMRALAKEIVSLQPDVIVGSNTPTTHALQRETRAIPIVFVLVADPEGEGFVESLSRPGRNLTGFIYLEAALASKWLQLLTEIAPGIKRVAMIFNPENAPGGGLYFQTTFETAARSLKLEPITAAVRSDAEIETVMTALARPPGSGLVLSPDSFMFVHRATIISLAAQYNVPAVYSETVHVQDGGLLSYGPYADDIFRRSASYVDRILRGAKPAELPVQLPIKFKMVVNAKTAKGLSLTVPQSILLRADEVIE
jgi:putative tryptophan/tyrosine transport system substrate-binding protein